RGLAAYDHLARVGPGLAWRRVDARFLQAEGPTGFPDLPWGEFVLDEQTLDLARVFLYADNPRLAPEPLLPDATVVYRGWESVEGAWLPRGMFVALPGEGIRVELTSPDYLVNPELPRPLRIGAPRGA